MGAYLVLALPAVALPACITLTLDMAATEGTPARGDKAHARRSGAGRNGGQVEGPAVMVVEACVGTEFAPVAVAPFEAGHGQQPPHGAARVGKPKAVTAVATPGVLPTATRWDTSPAAAVVLPGARVTIASRAFPAGTSDLCCWTPPASRTAPTGPTRRF